MSEDKFKGNLFLYILFIILVCSISFTVGLYNGNTVQHTTITENINYIQDINSSNYINFIENKHCACLEKGFDGLAVGENYEYCYKREIK